MVRELTGTHADRTATRPPKSQALGQFAAATRIAHRRRRSAATPSPQRSLPVGRTRATPPRAALKQALPDLVSADFYKADLSDVLSGDFAKFGYAKAGHAGALARAQSRRAAAVASESRQAARTRLRVAARSRSQMPLRSSTWSFRSNRCSRSFVRSVSATRASICARAMAAATCCSIQIGDTGTPSSLNDPGIPVGGSVFRVGAVTRVVSDFPAGQSVDRVAARDRADADRRVPAVCAQRRLVGRGRPAGATQVRGGRSEPRSRKRWRRNPSRSAAAAKPKAALAPPAPAKIEVDVDPSIFRAYDIRGVLGKTLTAGVARQIGRADRQRSARTRIPRNRGRPRRPSVRPGTCPAR